MSKKTERRTVPKWIGQGDIIENLMYVIDKCIEHKSIEDRWLIMQQIGQLLATRKAILMHKEKIDWKKVWQKK